MAKIFEIGFGIRESCSMSIKRWQVHLLVIIYVATFGNSAGVLHANVPELIIGQGCHFFVAFEIKLVDTLFIFKFRYLSVELHGKDDVTFPFVLFGRVMYIISYSWRDTCITNQLIKHWPYNIFFCDSMILKLYIEIAMSEQFIKTECCCLCFGVQIAQGRLFLF